jgi:hypothetical protein
VRHVDDSHDAENQAEARGNQKQYGGVENGIKNLDYKYFQYFSPLC